MDGARGCGQLDNMAEQSRGAGAGTAGNVGAVASAHATSAPARAPGGGLVDLEKELTCSVCSLP